MASAAKSAKPTAKLWRASSLQRLSRPVAPRIAASTPDRPAPADADNCLKPRVGKYDYSEQMETARAASAPRPGVVDSDEGPTSWSKYDGMAGTPSLQSKERRVRSEDDDDNYVWSKYGEPARRAIGAVPSAPSGPTPAPEPPAPPAEPAMVVLEFAEFAAQPMAPALGSFYAAWLDTGRGISLVLPKLKLSIDGSIDPALAVGNLAAPRALFWNGEPDFSAKLLVTAAFDPLLALTEPPYAEPEGSAPPRPIAKAEAIPEVLTFAGPNPLPLLHASRAGGRLVSSEHDGEFGDFSALAVLGASIDLDGEPSIERITLALPRPLAESEIEPSAAAEPVTEPSPAPTSVAVAWTNEPAQPTALAPEALTLGTPHLLPPGSGLDLPLGPATITALRALRVSMQLASESAAEPANLALPQALSLTPEDIEDPAPVISPSFDPLEALSTPVEAEPASAPSPIRTADLASVPVLPTLAAPVLLPPSTAEHEIDAPALASADAADFAEWREMPRLQSAVADDTEPEQWVPALGLPERMTSTDWEREPVALFLDPGIDPLRALAEPVEPLLPALEPPLPAASMDEAQPEVTPAANEIGYREEPEELPAPSSDIIDTASVEEPATEIEARDEGRGVGAPAIETAGEAEVEEPQPLPEPELASEIVDVVGVEEAPAAHGPEPATEIEAQDEGRDVGSPAFETAGETEVEESQLLAQPAFASEAEAPTIPPQAATTSLEPDPDAERSAAIAALTDQLSSVIGTVLQTKDYAALAVRRPRSTSDPGMGARRQTAPPAAATTDRKGTARVVELPRKRAATARSGAWMAMAATLAAMVVASGYFAYQLNALPPAVSASPALTEVAANSAPAPAEEVRPSVASIEPQGANYFESSRLVQPVSSSDSTASSRKPHQKSVHRP